jgi:hypothetical protein
MTNAIRIQEIRRKLDELYRQTTALHEELDARTLADAIERHPCQCVRLNGHIGIFDSGQQEAAGRVGLMLGLVANSISSVRDCPVCGGTGVPT